MTANLDWMWAIIRLDSRTIVFLKFLQYLSHFIPLVFIFRDHTKRNLYSGSINNKEHVYNLAMKFN